MTLKQMEAKTNQALDTARETIELFNSAKSQKVKDNLRKKLKHDLNKLYMSYDNINDRFILNDMLPKLELYNYQVNQRIYRSGISISKGYDDNGIETTKADYLKIEDAISTKKLSFKEAFLRYVDIMKSHPLAPALLVLEQQQPLIKPAYEKLGVKKVRNLKFVKKSIDAALKSLDTDKTTEQKLAIMMVGLIPVETVITVDRANKLMKQAYYQLGLSREPKSTDLHKWFDCSDPKSKRIDGKPTKVIEIYRSKIVFESKHNDA